MVVNRSDVSRPDSIHRDNSVTGANAMASSDDGSGEAAAFERTKRSREEDAAGTPGRSGFQTVAGASASSIATFRGPVRRSRYGAIDCRHESAACWRSAGGIVTCARFSTSAHVVGATAGPTPGDAANVGGAPGVAGAVCDLDAGALLSQATAPTSTPSGALMRNWRRVFMGRHDRTSCARCWNGI